MAMKIIQSVDPMHYGNLMGLMIGFMCFILGGAIWVIGFLVDIFIGPRSMDGGVVSFSPIAALIFVLLLGILGLILGFAGGVMSAYIYNFVASKIGGIKIELK